MGHPSPARKCARCGEAIPRERTAYLVSITLVADFDGTLPDPAGEAERSRLMREIESRSREELEKDVYERQSYFLCRNCREVWAQDPLGAGIRAEGAGRVH